jgi:hypothetical protein
MLASDQRQYRGDVVIDDVDAIFSAVSCMETFWTVALVGGAAYFGLMAPRGKIGMTGPTDDPPRVLSAKEIENWEDRGKIW